MKLAKASLSILRIKFISLLQFRAAAWAKISTFIFYGFVHVVLILIFYRYGVNSGAGTQAGMTVTQAVSYTWMVQVLAPIFLAGDNEINGKIVNGDVGVELCRPLDLYAHWFSRAMAAKLAPFLMGIVPVVAVAMLLPAPYNLQPPASPASLLAMIVCLCTGILLSCSIACLSYGLLLNIRWGGGPVGIIMLVTDIFSGSYLPLQLWPQWMQDFLYFQPFAGLVDIPLRLYVGTMAPGQVWQAAGTQIVWIAAFLVAGRLLMRRSLKNVVIQGG